MESSDSLPGRTSTQNGYGLARGLRFLSTASLAKTHRFLFGWPAYDVPCSFSFFGSGRWPGKLKSISRTRATAKPAPAVIKRMTSSV